MSGKGKPMTDDILESTHEVSDHTCLVKRPLVSVLMLAYNHARYLPQAIDSVLVQHCDFDFELLIGEDASSDDTRAIALAYQRSYPDVIRVVYSEKNVGARTNSNRILDKARGEYVAWCEGDDYWCLPDKLARQVGLIHGREDIADVHADWVKAHPDGDGWSVDWRHSVHRRVPLDRLQGDLFHTFHYPKILRTCTRLSRRSSILECMRSKLGKGQYRFGDAVKTAYLTSRWKVAYLPDIAAVYRLSPNSALRSGKQSRIDFLKSSLEFDTDARRFFSNRDDYPTAYRWEVAVGLGLWGISARDTSAMRYAAADLSRHFSPLGFVTAACETLRMRRPMLVPRQIHGDHLAAQS